MPADNNACATRAPCLACRMSRGHCLRLLHVFLVLNFYQTHRSTRSDNGWYHGVYFARTYYIIRSYFRLLLCCYIYFNYVYYYYVYMIYIAVIISLHKSNPIYTRVFVQVLSRVHCNSSNYVWRFIVFTWCTNTAAVYRHLYEYTTTYIHNTCYT